MNSSPNQLINEKSPYLQQHAYNPIQWMAWNAQSLSLAKELDKPIFLSIGYSSCHWCHVMEEESFSNVELAKIFNENFICIKVDREERPDLDKIYMKACQAITGQGGWPLNCFLTPEGKPFFASTYLPLEDKFQRPGMFRLGNAIQDLWKNKREQISKDSNNLIDVLESYKPEAISNDMKMPEPGLLESCAIELESRYDMKHGGFDQAPKFPNPHNLLFLLYRYQFRPDGMKYQVLNHTLNQMAMGGLFDHVGGGFTRYSTDSQWEIPHFEKMIWDNALLLLLYSEAAIQFDNPFYRYIAESTAMYLLRDLQSTESGFYTAEDADSEGREGTFYLWTYNELKDLFDDEFDEFCKTFKISEEGNFKDPHHPNLQSNHLTLTAETRAQLIGGNYKVIETIQKFQTKLQDVRKKRIRPFRDEKILGDGNALVSMALTRSARLLNQPYWIEVADRSARLIVNKMEQGDFLYHRLCDGELAIKSGLDDYAYLIWALIENYQSTLKEEFLVEALRFTELTNEYFLSEEGWYYYTLANQTDLVIRPVEVYDGATPAGNSVMAYNLIRLFHLTGKSQFKIQFEKLFSSLKTTINEHQSSYCFLMIALDHYYMDNKQLTFLNPVLDESEDREKWLNEVSQIMELKDLRLMIKSSSQTLNPDWYEIPALQSEKYMLCKDQTCLPPLSDFDLLKDLISGKV